MSTSVFISYARESDHHSEWVTALADRLETEEDIHVVFDEYDLHAGKDITHFMDEALRSDRIVVVVTPQYVTKAQGRMGGVGYEASVISADLLQDQLATRFIPVLRAGENLPPFLRSKHYVDFRVDHRYGACIDELLNALRGIPKRRRPAKQQINIAPESTAPMSLPAPVSPVLTAADLALRREILAATKAARPPLSSQAQLLRRAWRERDALFATLERLAVTSERDSGIRVVASSGRNECSVVAGRHSIVLRWSHRYLDDLAGAAVSAAEYVAVKSGVSEESRRTRFGLVSDGDEIKWTPPAGRSLTTEALADWIITRLIANARE